MLPYINNLRFPYENKLSLQIQMNPAISGILNSLSKRHDFHSTKRHLLGSAVKITKSLIPELYALYQTCLDLVGDQLEGELYVQQQSEYNAGVYAIGNRFDIVMASAIVKDFKQEEIAFVIGHELGHVLFEHNKIPVRLILSDCEHISYELASLLFQWSRTTEISADRIGLLCSGNLMSAANTFFKTSSGLSLEREDEIIRSLRTQYDELVKLSKPPGLSHDWICTHPLVPIRFKSLELICLDILKLRHQKSKVKVSWDRINSEIEEVLLKTEPLGTKKLHLSQQGLAVLMLCLLYVAVSDDELNQDEEAFIADIQRRIAPDLHLRETIAICKRNRRQFMTGVLSDIQNSKIPRDDTVVILELCYYLAIADRKLCNAETQAIEEVCGALGCEIMLVESVISQHQPAI